MKRGEKAKVFCPSNLAYGEKGLNTIVPPNQNVIFEIEILDWKEKEPEKPENPFAAAGDL